MSLIWRILNDEKKLEDLYCQDNIIFFARIVSLVFVLFLLSLEARIVFSCFIRSRLGFASKSIICPFLFILYDMSNALFSQLVHL